MKRSENTVAANEKFLLSFRSRKKKTRERRPGTQIKYKKDEAQEISVGYTNPARTVQK